MLVYKCFWIVNGCDFLFTESVGIVWLNQLQRGTTNKGVSAGLCLSGRLEPVYFCIMPVVDDQLIHLIEATAMWESLLQSKVALGSGDCHRNKFR